MNIISRAQWGARYPLPTSRAPLPARDVWLHSSDTPPPTADLASEMAAMRRLEEIGHIRFGGTVSYTFAIMPSGRVYEGHGVDRRGTHTLGRNLTSRGIVLVGRYTNTPPTLQQIMAAAVLLDQGHRRGWWLRPALSGGHRDIRNTACPGNAAYARIPAINRIAGAPPPPKPRAEDDMPFNPIMIQVPGDPAVYVTTVSGAVHVKNRVHKAWLVKAGVPETPTLVTQDELDALLEVET